jgi:hypothetical protein
MARAAESTLSLVGRPFDPLCAAKDVGIGVHPIRVGALNESRCGKNRAVYFVIAPIEMENRRAEKSQSARTYDLGATDGDVGSVIEFLFDDERWTVRYLVADTGGFMDGRRVPISPISFRGADW